MNTGHSGGESLVVSRFRSTTEERLDHIVHLGLILSMIGGPFEAVTCHPGDHDGGYVTVEFEIGCTGAIHMAVGSGQSSPVERVEIRSTEFLVPVAPTVSNQRIPVEYGVNLER